MSNREIKNSVLTINKIPTKNKDKIMRSPIPEVLPSHAFRAMFSGASRSGKTNLILTLLTDRRFYGGKKPYFSMVFLFSGSAHTDDAWQNAIPKYIKKQHAFSTLNVKALDDIWKIQEQIVKADGVNNAPRILIIFDDVIDSKNINKREFQRIYFRGRHLGISTMIATQKYNKVPFAVREQLTNLFLFKPRLKEMKTILDEITPAGMTMKQMQEIVETATALPFSFLHVDFKKDKGKMFRKNLDTILRFE